jgi:DNA-binding CsgD family transcriptional regulator
MFRLLRGAELALGQGDEATAAECLEQVEPKVESATEPQWIGSFGALSAELHRRQRNFPAARAAVAHALDRIELCTDDVARIARVAAAGLRVEADIAQRARDLVERREERDAVARARLHMERLRAAATDGGPIEGAWEATSKAELARARGRSAAGLWRAAAECWEAVERPYEVAIARWREAEALAGSGDRATAAEPAERALETAEKLGSHWLTGELRALIQRARLQLEGRAQGDAAAGDDVGAEDPFGLTPREREVLALIAQGATNRQIGAALFMAEKTASVHVSRILAKLGVSRRTEAAAVAHRLGLASRPNPPDLAGARPR